MTRDFPSHANGPEPPTLGVRDAAASMSVGAAHSLRFAGAPSNNPPRHA